jgi:hypothetical protein
MPESARIYIFIACQTHSLVDSYCDDNLFIACCSGSSFKLQGHLSSLMMSKREVSHSKINHVHSKDHQTDLDF